MIVLLTLLLFSTAQASDTTKAKKKHIPEAIDILIGAGSTDLNISSNPGFGDYKAESRYGLSAGVMVETGFYDIEMGFMYAERRFLLKPPASLRVYGIDTAFREIRNRYVLFPLNYHFLDFVFNDFLTIGAAIGSYLGFLLSSDENAGLGIKKLDFGIEGRLFGSFAVSNRFDPMVGLILQFGGINDISSSKYVNTVRTTHLTYFAGARIKL
jgi:hypothetical protein